MPQCDHEDLDQTVELWPPTPGTLAHQSLETGEAERVAVKKRSVAPLQSIGMRRM